MSRKHRKPPASTEASAPPDPDDLDGDETSTPAPAPTGGVDEDFGDLDALADSDADPDAPPPPEPPPIAVVPPEPPPIAEDPASPDATVNIATATAAPPGAFSAPISDTLMDAVATGEAEPAEPTGAPPSLATETAPKAKPKGKKPSPADILGDPETMCARATAAATMGPLLDIAIAALPVYVRQGGGWQQVIAEAGRRSQAYTEANGPTPFDLNVDGMGDVAGLLMRGPSAVLFQEFTVYQFAAAEGEMPMAAMPGDLPLPPSLKDRVVKGSMKVPATPGMAAVYNLADKGQSALGPVLDAVAGFLGKHGDVVRPVIALLIVGLAGYRHDRAIARSLGGIDVAHDPPKAAPPAP